MSDRLKGKRAVVTAAAAGIGRACAVAFAREGATVIATDINEKGIAALAEAGIAETTRLDVRNTADVNAFAKRVGKIDILLNAAGFVHHGTIMDCSEEDWDFSFDLNVKSMHRTIRAFLPAMLAGGGGSIVNISSCAGARDFFVIPGRAQREPGIHDRDREYGCRITATGFRNDNTHQHEDHSDASDPSAPSSSNFLTSAGSSPNVTIESGNPIRTSGQGLPTPR